MRVAALVAISQPILSCAQVVASTQGSIFVEAFARADALVEKGHAGSLLDVQLPLPMLIAAGAFVEKYGPSERYNYLKFLRGLQAPALVLFGGQEVESNMAFQGRLDAVKALAAVQPRLEVETVAGADHLYTSRRPELLRIMQRWLCNVSSPEPIIQFKSLDSPDMADLLLQAQAELNQRYPDDDPHPRLPQAGEFREPEGSFLGVWLGDHFVACGGIRRWSDRTAEVKRMFVEPAVRRRGVGRLILQSLEKKPVPWLSPDTPGNWPAQPKPSLSMSKPAHRIPAYGDLTIALSVCFEKNWGVVAVTSGWWRVARLRGNGKLTKLCRFSACGPVSDQATPRPRSHFPPELAPLITHAPPESSPGTVTRNRFAVAHNGYPRRARMCRGPRNASNSYRLNRRLDSIRSGSALRRSRVTQCSVGKSSVEWSHLPRSHRQSRSWATRDRLRKTSTPMTAAV